MLRKLVIAALALAALVGAPGGATAADATADADTLLARYDRSQVSTTSISAAQAMALGEQSTGIGPGSHLLMTMEDDPDSTYGCTANFVWSAGGRLYLGAAGHCFLPADKVATDGVDADYDASRTHVEVCVADCTNGGVSGFLVTGETVALGPVAYARQSSSGDDDADDIGYDFGVVEIPSELHDLVRTTMPVFGGPVSADGELEAGEITCHFGHAAGLGEVYPTQGRVGTGIFEDDGAWFAATPSFQGDSGAALQTCVEGDGGLVGDEAIGALTHLSSLGVAGTTVERAVELARDAGLSLTLVLRDPAGGAEQPPAGPAPSVSAVDPSSADAGATLQVTVSGSDFAEGATLAFVGGQGPAPKVSIVSVDATTIVADVTVPKQAKTSTWDVVVTNPDGQRGSLAGGFSVRGAR